MGEMEHHQQHDPTRMRISDKERQQVADVLQRAAGEGRLDLHELDERLEATWAAKTYGDLVPITADLPAVPGDRAMSAAHDAAPAAYDPHAPSPATSFSVLSGITRKGVWTIGERHTAVAIMGGVDLDLREAQFTSPRTTIYAHAVMGGIDVVVNERTRVVVDGIGLMGAFEQGRDKVPPVLDPGSPVVRVTGFALMGGVTVTRKQMPGQPRPKRRLLGS